MNEGHGAAGILIGNGKMGYYLMFGIDKEGRYHIVQKSGNKTTPIFSGSHEIIRAGQANRLHHDIRDEFVVFFANGTELISVPFDPRREKGLALAAFGLGTYSFDDVEIVAGDEVENPFENKILKLPPRFKKAPFKTY